MEINHSLSMLSMSHLVTIHNLVADTPVTAKTFSQRSKAVDRITKIATEKGIDLGRRLRQDEDNWVLVPTETPVVAEQPNPNPQDAAQPPANSAGELQAATEAGSESDDTPPPNAVEIKAATAPTKPKGRSRKALSTEAKPKGPSIRSVAEQLLLQVVGRDEDKRPIGRPYEDILIELRDKFAGCKTTVACLRWYAVHMRERDVKVPSRPRAISAAKEELLATAEEAAA